MYTVVIAHLKVQSVWLLDIILKSEEYSEVGRFDGRTGREMMMMMMIFMDLTNGDTGK